ncbi:jg12956, partial [Pararge aegeria aegeria]
MALCLKFKETGSQVPRCAAAQSGQESASECGAALGASSGMFAMLELLAVALALAVTSAAQADHSDLQP